MTCRTLSFIKSNFNSKIPEMADDMVDFVTVVRVNRELTQFQLCMERLKLRDGLKHVLAISRIGNKFFQANEPWKLVKGSPDDKYD